MCLRCQVSTMSFHFQQLTRDTSFQNVNQSIFVVGSWWTKKFQPSVKVEANWTVTPLLSVLSLSCPHPRILALAHFISSALSCAVFGPFEDQTQTHVHIVLTRPLPLIITVTAASLPIRTPDHFPSLLPHADQMNEHSFRCFQFSTCDLSNQTFDSPHFSRE